MIERFTLRPKSVERKLLPSTVQYLAVFWHV